jgi:hypothetical protein
MSVVEKRVCDHYGTQKGVQHVVVTVTAAVEPVIQRDSSETTELFVAEGDLCPRAQALLKRQIERVFRPAGEGEAANE